MSKNILSFSLIPILLFSLISCSEKDTGIELPKGDQTVILQKPKADTVYVDWFGITVNLKEIRKEIATQEPYIVKYHLPRTIMAFELIYTIIQKIQMMFRKIFYRRIIMILSKSMI